MFSDNYRDFEYCASGGDMSNPYESDSVVGSGPGTHSVEGYYRSDGTYVRGHMRSNPNGNSFNNLNL